MVRRVLRFSDVIQPPSGRVHRKYEGEADKVNENYEVGMLSPKRASSGTGRPGTERTSEVSEAVEEHFDPKNNPHHRASPGARGNMMQINQIAGRRHRGENPKGEIIPRPAKSNYREACPSGILHLPARRA